MVSEQLPPDDPSSRSFDPDRRRQPKASGPSGGVSVGRFFGVPLYFAPSWLLIAALITISYSQIVYDSVNGISRPAAYLIAFAFAALLALSVLAHELGHTAVSLVLGHPVKRVVIFLLGGVSEIDRELKRARDEFFVALAGPLVSLLIAGAAWLAHGWFSPHSIPSVLLALLLWSNLIVAVFNLLPGLPLDGGRVLRAGIWGIFGNRLTGTRVAANVGRVLGVLVAASIFLLDRNSWSFATGLFAVAMGAFIWIGATQSLKMAELAERVPNIQLGSLLRAGVMVPSDTSVAEALRQTWEHNARGIVVVDAAAAPRAIVDEARVRALPLPQRPWTPISDVARAIEPGMVLPLTLGGDDLLDAVRQTPAREYLVVRQDGSPAGILAADDLTAVLMNAT